MARANHARTVHVNLLLSIFQTFCLDSSINNTTIIFSNRKNSVSSSSVGMYVHNQMFKYVCMYNYSNYFIGLLTMYICTLIKINMYHVRTCLEMHIGMKDLFPEVQIFLQFWKIYSKGEWCIVINWL